MDSLEYTGSILQYWDKWQGCLDCEATQKVWNAAELRNLSSKIADNLVQQGIVAGDVVAIITGNTVVFPIIVAALLSLDANLILLHESITDDELYDLRFKINIKFIVHDFLPNLSRIDLYNYEVLQKYQIKNLSVQLLKFKKETGKNAYLLNHKGVVIQPSSGTYGQPKLCIREQAAIIAEAVNYTDTISLYKNIKMRVTTGLNHAYAFGFGFIGSLVSNSTLVVSPSFNPKKILRQETEKTSDILAIVPTMMSYLMHFKLTDPSYILPKEIFTSGASCDENLYKQFKEVFKCNLYTNYGTTETGVISTTYHGGDVLFGVGKVFYGVDIELRNQNEYSDFENNVGDIYVKATSMMAGYFNDMIKKNDYFMTGDIGFYDANHNLHLIGRMRDIININGFKVNPIKVESVILEYFGVKDCAVYPGKTKTGAEVVLAAIQGDKNLNVLELRKFCYKRLNIHMIPRKFYVLSVIPRTASGKCRKIDLPGYCSISS